MGIEIITDLNIKENEKIKSASENTIAPSLNIVTEKSDNMDDWLDDLLN